MDKPHNMRDSIVIVDSGFDAETLPVTETMWSEIDEKYGDFGGRSLISQFSFEDDWPTWEVHPAGDEFVVLISGASEMVLAMPEGDRTIVLDEPGDFVIVPKGTWHTARISTPTKMLFVTPGEGTLNREEPERGRT